MTWKLRHQGSTRQVENLTLAQVVEGLQDGLWEPTDEVMGPQDRGWIAIESHPQLAEAADDLTSASATRQEDETRLDMTALIDVTLVLLIFFILTTTYQTLEKILDMPGSKSEEPGALRKVTEDDAKRLMIEARARLENGKPAFWVDGKAVEEDRFARELRRVARETRKKELLLDAAGIDYGTVVKMIDAAGGAKIEKVHFKVGATPSK